MANDGVKIEPRPRLGRGLAALLGAARDETPTTGAVARLVPVDLIKPNPRNPRRSIVDTELAELANSIKEKGILQPVVVRKITAAEPTYEIVAGERRWRAAQVAGLHELPVLLIEASDREALEVAIVENVQRSDLKPLEEAAGYARLCNEHGYSQADIARIVGKSRSHIANTLRLLNLPELSRRLLDEGKLSAGHARALLTVSEPDQVADKIVKRGLTVRDVERLVGTLRATNPKRPETDPDTSALQEKLCLALGAKVALRCSGEVGELRIAFQSLKQLDDLCRRLCQLVAPV